MHCLGHALPWLCVYDYQGYGTGLQGIGLQHPLQGCRLVGTGLQLPGIGLQPPCAAPHTRAAPQVDLQGLLRVLRVMMHQLLLQKRQRGRRMIKALALYVDWVVEARSKSNAGVPQHINVPGTHYLPGSECLHHMHVCFADKRLQRLRRVHRRMLPACRAAWPDFTFDTPKWHDKGHLPRWKRSHGNLDEHDDAVFEGPATLAPPSNLDAYILT